MRSKVSAGALAVLLAVGAWWWIALDTPRGLPEVEEATEVGQERHERAGDSRPGLASPKSSHSNPSRGRSVPQSGISEPTAARSDAARRTGAPLELQESSSTPPVLDEQDREGSGGSEEERKQKDFGRFKRQLASLRAASQEVEGAEPIDLDTDGLAADDVDHLDMDGDGTLSPMELERARRLIERAENHPVRNDRGDGAYPIERADYGRPEEEFIGVDTNRDGLIDVDEYYSLLVDAEKISLYYDVDEDKEISFDESGLSKDEFEPLDFNNSGQLNVGEIRRAVAIGVFDSDLVED